MVRLELVIFGRVQGVNFRTATQAKARSLGLVGWVANHPDGTVRLAAEGQRRHLQELLEWCYSGVAAASVDQIDARWQVAFGRETTFTILTIR